MDRRPARIVVRRCVVPNSDLRVFYRSIPVDEDEPNDNHRCVAEIASGSDPAFVYDEVEKYRNRFGSERNLRISFFSRIWLGSTYLELAPM